MTFDCTEKDKTFSLVSGYVTFDNEMNKINVCCNETEIKFTNVRDLVNLPIFEEYVKKYLPIKNTWEKDFKLYKFVFTIEKFITGYDVKYKFEKGEKVNFVALKYGDELVLDIIRKEDDEEFDD